MKSVVIVAAARSPIGSFNGGLASFSAPDLGAMAIREVLKRGSVAPGQVDEVIMGNVLTAGEGQAPARQAALKAGLPEKTPSTTVNKVCASGMKAVMYAANQWQELNGKKIPNDELERISNRLAIEVDPAGIQWGNKRVFQLEPGEGIEEVSFDKIPHYYKFKLQELIKKDGNTYNKETATAKMRELLRQPLIQGR